MGNKPQTSQSVVSIDKDDEIFMVKTVQLLQCISVGFPGNTGVVFCFLMKGLNFLSNNSKLNFAATCKMIST